MGNKMKWRDGKGWKRERECQYRRQIQERLEKFLKDRQERERQYENARLEVAAITSQQRSEAGQAENF